MTKPTRKEKQHEIAREEIKALAWRQIAEQGTSSLSLRWIATQMGLTSPALYRYYPDRNALVTALIIDAYAAFTQALEAGRDAAPPENHAERLYQLGLAYRDWAVTNPQRYILIFGAPIPGYRMCPETFPAARKSFMVLLDVIEAAYQAGALRLSLMLQALPERINQALTSLAQEGIQYPPLVTDLALATWSWVHGLVTLELYDQLPAFLGEAVPEFFDQQLRAFLETIGLVVSG